MSTVYMSAANAHERRRGPDGPRAAAPLCVAALCLAALALTWVVAALVPATHYKDAVALYRFTLLGGPRLDEIAEGLLGLLEPIWYTVWAVAIVAVALWRRRPQLGFAVALVLALAPMIAELLKPLLAHGHASVGDTSVGAASWPSGHATAVTVLALCAALVAPERLRPAVAAVGVTLMAAVGFSLVVLAWHLPSDVLGGYLLGTLCVALALAGVRLAQAGAPVRRRSP
ncbi:MAG TPA: phosphatase PAP2 family protein [Solirubrobacteraceae bacterium]|nr:phosphatase PAP2 family protein [Solirubrobacteraceae bacterium]